MVLLFYISEQKLFYEVSKLGYFMMISSGAIFFYITIHRQYGDLYLSVFISKCVGEFSKF